MIKNIIFDFGGVLLNLDMNKTFSALSSLLEVDLSRDIRPKHIQEFLDSYESGGMNNETFLWKLQKAAKGKTPQPDKLIKAWNAMLLGWNPDRFQFLEDLKNRYQVFLLSNTNDIHLQWVKKDLKNQHNIEDWEERFFHKTFYSHLMDARKPESIIYRKLLEETGIEAHESLFIDDNLDNIEAARAIGIKAIHHNPKNEIINMLPLYLESFSEESEE